LVWQDFLFACASYSEEALGHEVEAEARQNITRIMKHPSLALWNGNNENLWGHQEWNWAQRLEGKSWGSGFYFELLPKLVKELDPTSPYTPGSPFSPDAQKAHNDPSAGSVHIWDLWNQKDYPHYLDYEPRFVAEFGWQGPANWATIKQSISDDPLTPESPGMVIHQKAMNGNDKLTDGLVNHFSLPNRMEDWHWAMQLNQANAIRFGLEHMRNQFPRCMGAVVWQLNDCWPVTSWAAIDGAGRQKPLYFSIAQSYEPLLVTISKSTALLQVNIINNQIQEAVGALKLRLMSFDGKKLAEHEQAISVPGNSKQVIEIAQNLSTSETESASCLVASFAGKRAIWFFADYRHLKLASVDIDTELATTPTGFQLKIKAKNLIRDLLVMIDKIDPDASIDKGLVTLLPGESALFEIQSKAKLTIEQFSVGRVIRSANELVAK
jgi:beta-mannosidase